MCYSCQRIELPTEQGRSVLFQRAYDPYTQPTDFDLDESAIAGFQRGDWGYVALSATILNADGEPLSSYSLYGVAEWEGSPCALKDAKAVEWVTAQALNKAMAITQK